MTTEVEQPTQPEIKPELEEKYRIERAKWDAHAHAHVGVLPTDLIVSPDLTFATYTRGKTLFSGMSEFLGSLDDRDVLEYGCGLGELTVILARSGARVTTFDISEASVDAARTRVEANGVEDRVEFAVASAEELPFPDGRFDLVVGKAILHHLDPELGPRELARVMRPGGRAAFSEPMGTNPLLKFVRDHVPYPNKHERGADRPLTSSDVKAWAVGFQEFHIHEVQLLSMVERAFGFRRKFKTLRRMDAILLARIPYLRRFCRYAILTFVR
jgi:2-polyprenyl-3-methyl-5-hydroxy-6-metoxy-1,4-benzoquinol methylase